MPLPDREKVIRGLECCGRWTGDALWDEVRCSQCPYDSTEIGCGHRLTADTLALLREQEPVKPKREDAGHRIIMLCGACGAPIPTHGGWRYYKYCPTCGRGIKWGCDE